MLLFPSFIMAMFISMVLIPPLIKFAPKIGLVDIPDARKVHKNVIPRVGGIAMVIAAIIPAFIWLPFNSRFLSFLVSVIIIFTFGVWDDRSNLNYKIKFFGQIVATVIIVIIGDVQIRQLPFCGLEPVSEWISIPLTIFVILGITNAMNLVDGLDGLAGGTTLISFGAIGLLGYVTTIGENIGTPYITLIAISIMGSILGFLRFNTHPARIFMGDTGSQFLGFTIGSLAIMITQQNDLPYNPGIPLILLCWPIFDTLMVMSIRIAQGKSPFVADKNHIHHRLLAIGLDHYEVVFVIYFVQACLAVVAFCMRNFSDLHVMATYIAINLCAVAFIFWADKNRGRFAICDEKTGLKRKSGKNRLGRYIHIAIKKGLPADVAFYVSLLSFPAAYLFAIIIIRDGLERDIAVQIGLVSAVVAVIMLLTGYICRKEPIKLPERIGAYLIAALIVYTINELPEQYKGIAPVINIFFVVLAITVVTGFRFSKDYRFKVTTLDFLVIFSVIMLNITPIIPAKHSLFGLHLVLFFYALEYLISSINKHTNIYRISSVTMLALFSLRCFYM